MQIHSGQASVSLTNPRQIELVGITANDATLLAPGHLFKFAGETTTALFHTVAQILIATPPVLIELIDDYSGSHVAGVPADYLIVRDFTPIHALPELGPADVDIRDVYTAAMRLIDPALTASVLVSGITAVTLAATAQQVIGTFPTPPYGVLVTPNWLTTVRVRSDATKSANQFFVDFGTAAPASAEIAWAVLT